MGKLKPHIVESALHSIRSNGLADDTRNGVEGRLECAWHRYGLACAYGLSSGESVALHTSLAIGRPEFLAYDGERLARLNAAYEKESN